MRLHVELFYPEVNVCYTSPNILFVGQMEPKQNKGIIPI